MHTLARFPAREASLNRQVGSRAFTLIELLTVIAIIAILAGITFGVVKGVNERAAIGQAKAELAALTQALEAYKKQYGDYPKGGAVSDSTSSSGTPSATDGPGILLNSLIGRLGPYMESSSSRAAINGKAFIDLSRFSLQSTTAIPTTGSASNSLLDPWGRRYIYYYKTGTSAAWLGRSYILLSAGPDGNVGLVPNTSGTITVSTTNEKFEADNIYAVGRPPKT